MTELLPVFHVGFHKSASTTLPKALFLRHPEVASLGEPKENSSAMEAVRAVMRACHRDPAQRSDFDLERCRRLWREALATVAPGRVPVFSKETLTRCDFYRAPGDRCLPEKLHSVVGPARIVIMARHQIRLLESLYITRTKGPAYKTPDQWFQANSGGTVHMYRYHAVARSFADVFGRENVAVFLLEDLQADAGAFARRLCDFIGIDGMQGAVLLRDERRNIRTSHRHHIYSRLRKRLGPNVSLGRLLPGAVRDAFLGFITGGGGAKVELPTRWVAEMESYYREDNRRLAADWGLPLERYGYPL